MDTDGILRELIEGQLRYLYSAQEEEGEFAGAFWSALAYHVPHFDYHAGGSHHYRTPGSAGLAFAKLAPSFLDLGLLARTEKAFDWICERQHEDGGLFEITNCEQPSQFHLDYERSSISLGMVAQGLFKSFALGLPGKPEYLRFLEKAAAWQMTVEVAPGNFLHSEGYPEQYTILNSCAHAAETLLIGSEVTEDTELEKTWRAGAYRAIDAILDGQRVSGMFPYRIPDENQHTISYTATCIWVLQNLMDAHMIEKPYVCNALKRACCFLCDSVGSEGALLWEGREVHGQKHHTWVYGMVCRALAWWHYEEWNRAVARMLGFIHRELFDADVALPRLYDFPLGTAQTICGHVCEALPEFACAFNQADMLDCLIDTRALLSS